MPEGSFMLEVDTIEALLKGDPWCDDREALLVHEAKAGSQEAWAEVYQRHFAPLFRYTLARVHDPSVAEDLVAAVFLEAVRGIDSYSYRGRPLLAWLYRIARNVIADHLRREGGRRLAGLEHRPRRLLRFLGAGKREDGEPNLGPREPSSTHDDVGHLDLKRALATLSGQQREVVILHYFGGFSLREVARILQKNERAVYSLQARALASLRAQLGEG